MPFPPPPPRPPSTARRPPLLRGGCTHIAQARMYSPLKNNFDMGSKIPHSRLCLYLSLSSISLSPPPPLPCMFFRSCSACGHVGTERARGETQLLSSTQARFPCPCIHVCERQRKRRQRGRCAYLQGFLSTLSPRLPLGMFVAQAPPPRRLAFVPTGRSRAPPASCPCWTVVPCPRGRDTAPRVCAEQQGGGLSACRHKSLLLFVTWDLTAQDSAPFSVCFFCLFVLSCRHLSAFRHVQPRGGV